MIPKRAAKPGVYYQFGCQTSINRTKLIRRDYLLWWDWSGLWETEILTYFLHSIVGPSWFLSSLFVTPMCIIRLIKICAGSGKENFLLLPCTPFSRLYFKTLPPELSLDQVSIGVIKLKNPPFTIFQICPDTPDYLPSPLKPAGNHCMAASPWNTQLFCRTCEWRYHRYLYLLTILGVMWPSQG